MRPIPSSQLACAIGGNIAMNSGGAHCLKYGVTTNNLLGVTAGADGWHRWSTLGGPDGGRSGLDLLGVICGSEGQLGIVTEATLRILPKPAGARPVLIAFDSAEVAGACVARSSGRHPAGCHRIHGPPLHPRHRGFLPARAIPIARRC
jgi:glycolate oxidase